jgi:DNA-binding MarR family transcriptional regulator
MFYALRKHGSNSGAAMAEGLDDSDFRVLDVLLPKEPIPVNAIGPKVDLNPGSVSVAVDRLCKKGWSAACRARAIAGFAPFC